MHHALILLVRGLAAGCLVLLFSAAAETVRPRSAAGVLSAAPSVALASLAITVLDRSAATAALAALGMIGGGVAMVFCCLAGTDSVRRFKAARGSVVIVAAWMLAAAGIEAGLLR